MNIINLKNQNEYIVTENDTAQNVGSGSVNVLGTPRLISWIEETSWKTIQPMLEEGWGSVGTEINIKHISPTPIGMKIVCCTRVIEVNSKEITFKCECFDEKSKIAEGTHKRFIANLAKFEAKAISK